VNVYGIGFTGGAGGVALGGPPGSGGTSGSSGAQARGGLYGGGGAGCNDAGTNGGLIGEQGVVRIIWPGDTRQFPRAAYGKYIQ
jgi:hypothetical protein